MLYNRPDTAPTISSRADLITAIPYLLGFHPTDSLVLVGLADARLVVTARLDLPDDPDGTPPIVGATARRTLGPVAVPDPAWTAMLGQTLQAMASGGTHELVAIAYPGGPDVSADTTRDDHDPAMSSTALLPSETVLSDAALGAELQLLHYLRVAGRRWRSVRCPSPDCRPTGRCCPPEGHLLPQDPSPFIAHAVCQGTAPAASRGHIADRFRPDTDIRRPAEIAASIAAQLREHDQKPFMAEQASSAFCALLGTLIASPTSHVEPSTLEMSADDIGGIGIALTDVTLRDATWITVDTGHGPPQQLWLCLARQLPAPYNAAPLFLYAWQAWRDGDGVVARTAAEHALLTDNNYSAARLLIRLLDAGISPQAVPSLATVS